MSAASRSPRLRVVRGVAELGRAMAPWRRRGERIAYVPTMGALHRGHTSLIQRARTTARRVVVSAFVNPLQFGPHEDYRRYPRPVAKDRALLSAEGVDLVWEPRVEDVYPSEDRTRVRVTGLESVLEGASRPGHFEGVATVVLKLVNAVRPDVLWLGQKDAQQALLIERMIDDLFIPVVVRRGPTVREPDGLAMSSRNGYLDPEERRQAVALYQGLSAARDALDRGERSAARLMRTVRGVWRNYPRVREDYVAVVDPATLDPVPTIRGPVLVAVAARVGRARLIDNIVWKRR